MNRAEHRVLHPAHTQAWSLLPWYVNDSLGEGERTMVRAHLGECLVCAREQRRLEALAAAVAGPVEEHACSQAYGRLAQRLGAMPGRPAVRRPRVLFEPLPLVAGALLLVCSSALVGGIVLSRAPVATEIEQPFQTLGGQGTQGSGRVEPVLRVVLQDPSAAALRVWLDRHRAEVLDGPSAIGVLTVKVALAPRTFESMLAGMRADDATLFVEPVSMVGMRPDRLR
jgi:hypothetical protein